MREQSKAALRRKNDPRFAGLWLVGRGIDVGCGNDPISKEDWPRIEEVVPWDVLRGDGDAQYMDGIPDASFDFVHASHVLEHTVDPRVALLHWARILRPRGHVVCTVPDEVLYECCAWPSKFNRDHKSSFTLRGTPTIPGSYNVGHVLWKSGLDVEKLELVRDGWDVGRLGQDQTLTGAECSIEFVVRKGDLRRPW